MFDGVLATQFKSQCMTGIYFSNVSRLIPILYDLEPCTMVSQSTLLEPRSVVYKSQRDVGKGRVGEKIVGTKRTRASPQLIREDI